MKHAVDRKVTFLMEDLLTCSVHCHKTNAGTTFLEATSLLFFYAGAATQEPIILQLPCPFCRRLETLV